MLQLPDLSTALVKFAVAFVPAITGIVCHEVAHGYVAYRFGDPTAKAAGRLTLNPIKHIDPMGLLVFTVTALFTSFVIGWAKPVPVNSRYFKQPRESMVLVAFAGPITNFILAIVFAILAAILAPLAITNEVLYFAYLSATVGVYINCGLGWFNLFPIPPLDGSHILFGVLPRPLAVEYAKLSQYGFIIIIMCLYFNVFGKVLGPLVNGSAQTLIDITNIL